MPRRSRDMRESRIYHVLNRAAGRRTIFEKDADYTAFQRALQQAGEREPVRLLAYCLMPNHWHLIVWAEAIQELSEFMR